MPLPSAPPRSRAGLVALAVVTLVVSGCGGGSSAERAAAEREEQARRVAEEAGLPEEVGELLARAAGIVDEQYRVTYEPEAAEAGVITITQRPPERRVDVRAAAAGGGQAERSVFSLEDRTVTCTRGDRRWFCQTTDDDDAVLPGEFAEADVEGTIDALARARRDYRFDVTEERVAGVAATCLATTLRPGRRGDPDVGPEARLCVSGEGVPLLVEGPSGGLRAVRYTTDVPDDAFDLPARPQGDAPDRTG